MRVRERWHWYWLGLAAAVAVAGLALIGKGALEHPDHRPLCDGLLMGPQDTCRIQRGIRVSYKTADQMAHLDDDNGLRTMLVGAAVVAVGLLGAWLILRMDSVSKKQAGVPRWAWVEVRADGAGRLAPAFHRAETPTRDGARESLVQYLSAKAAKPEFATAAARFREDGSATRVAVKPLLWLVYEVPPGAAAEPHGRALVEAEQATLRAEILGEGSAASTHPA